MWIVRWILIALLIVAILGFSHQNSQPVKVQISNWQTGEIPLYLVAYVAFGIGLIVSLLISSYHQFMSQIRIRSYKKEIKSLRAEIAELSTDNNADPVDIDQTEDEIEDEDLPRT